MIRVVFMGRKRQAACALEWMASNPDIEVVGALTDFHLAGSPTAAVAEKHRIPLYLYDDAQRAIDTGELQFDLGVSLGYWRVVKETMLSAPALGIINIHPAPLPELRGRGGYNIALLEEHTEYWVTAHYMNEGVDTGPIIERLEVPIDPKSDTALELGNRAMEAAVVLCKRVVTDAVNAAPTLLDTTANEGGRSYCWRDVEPLKQIVDGDNVDLKARAFWFPPYEGAWVEVAGERVTATPQVVLDDLGGDDTFLTPDSRSV